MFFLEHLDLCDYFWAKNNIPKCGVLQACLCFWDHRGGAANGSRGPTKMQVFCVCVELKPLPYRSPQHAELRGIVASKLYINRGVSGENSWEGTSERLPFPFSAYFFFLLCRNIFNNFLENYQLIAINTHIQLSLKIKTQVDRCKTVAVMWIINCYLGQDRGLVCHN